MQRPKDPSAVALATLGLPRYASEAEVRTAYKKIIVREHPDKGGTQERFQAIQSAYKHLQQLWAQEEQAKHKQQQQQQQQHVRGLGARAAPQHSAGLAAAARSAKMTTKAPSSYLKQQQAQRGDPAEVQVLREGEEDGKGVVPSADMKRLGDEALEQGDAARALEYYNAAAAHMLTDNVLKYAELYEARARAHAALHCWEEAAEDAERACVLRPLWVAAFVAKGRALMAMEMWAAAQGAYARAVELDPQHPQHAEAEEGLMAAQEKLRTAACLAVCHGHSGGVRQCAFSPPLPSYLQRMKVQRPVVLATCGEDGSVRVWSVPQGEQMMVLRGHQGMVRCLCWCPDGSGLLLTAGEDATARLWDVYNTLSGRGAGTCVKVVQGHTGPLTHVTFDVYGSVFATCSEDGTAMVWDSGTGTLVLALARLHRWWVSKAAFSPSGRTLTTASDDGTARVWDMVGDVEEPGECLHTLLWDSGQVNDVVYTPCGRFILIATHMAANPERECIVDPTDAKLLCYRILMWSAVSGRILRWHDGHMGIITRMAFRPKDRAASQRRQQEEEDDEEDFDTLITTSLDGSFREWEVMPEGGYDGKSRVEVAYFRGNRVKGRAEMAARARTLGYIRHNEGIYQGAIYDACFNGKGDRLITGSQDGRVRVYHGKRYGVLYDWSGHEAPVRSVHVAPDDQYFASASEDGTARIWRPNAATEGKLAHQYRLRIEARKSAAPPMLAAPLTRALTDKIDDHSHCDNKPIIGPQLPDGDGDGNGHEAEESGRSSSNSSSSNSNSNSSSSSSSSRAMTEEPIDPRKAQARHEPPPPPPNPAMLLPEDMATYYLQKAVEVVRPPEAEAAQRIVESSKCKPVAATECADEEVNMEHATESFLARFVPAERFSGSRPGMFFAVGALGLGYYPDVPLSVRLAMGAGHAKHVQRQREYLHVHGLEGPHHSDDEDDECGEHDIDQQMMDKLRPKPNRALGIGYAVDVFGKLVAPAPHSLGEEGAKLYGPDGPPPMIMYQMDPKEKEHAQSYTTNLDIMLNR